MSTGRKAPGSRYNRADVKAAQAGVADMTIGQMAMAFALLRGGSAVTPEDYRMAQMFSTVQQRAALEITSDAIELSDDLFV